MELVNKERNKVVNNPGIQDFLEFLQVQHDPQELLLLKTFILNNFETPFNESVLV